jgi:hypothetical protein
MATQWSPKDPNDTADYTFDWDDFLPTGEIITDATLAVSDAALTIVADDFTDRTVRVRLSGGEAATNYTVDCTITTDAGQIFEVTKTLPVRERIK